MAFRTIDDGHFTSQRVLLRVDLNVPVKDGQVTDVTRIERIKPTLDELSQKGAKIILLSHFGRPKGQAVAQYSLAQIIPALQEILGKTVSFSPDCIGEVMAKHVATLQDGDILLAENTRFYAGEEANDTGFAKNLAENGDIYVNDAFSSAHRAHASTEGLAHLLPAYAGRAMQGELTALEQGLGAPKKPLVAIVGGAKVSTKIDLLNNLVARVDALVIGGGMANTFLAAKGLSVGKSLCEPSLGETARAIMAKAENHNCTIILPIDATVAYHFEANAPNQHYSIDAIPETGMILDTGARSVERINAVIDEAATVIWNGPLGAFELTPFDRATVDVARHVARLAKKGQLICVAGGGDTVAALNHAGVTQDFTYVSTAGGAFLEWMEGKILPGVLALEI